MASDGFYGFLTACLNKPTFDTTAGTEAWESTYLKLVATCLRLAVAARGLPPPVYASAGGGGEVIGDGCELGDVLVGRRDRSLVCDVDSVGQYCRDVLGDADLVSSFEDACRRYRGVGRSACGVGTESAQSVGVSGGDTEVGAESSRVPGRGGLGTLKSEVESGVRVVLEDCGGLEPRDLAALRERGKNWKKNHRKLQKRKEKRQNVSDGFSGTADASSVETKHQGMSFGVAGASSSSDLSVSPDGVPSSIPVSLRASWVARKNAENLLAKKRAENELKLQEARDLDVERAARRTKNVKLSEQYKVEIEKAYMKLKETGNSGCMTVLDETVNRLSDVAVGEEPGLTNSSGVNSGSISPNSSASMAEFRAVQKRCLDLEAELKKNAHTIKRLQQFARLDKFEQVAFSFVDDVLAPSVQEKLDELEEAGYNYRTDGHIEDPTLYVTKENKWTDAEFDYEFDKMK